MTPNPNPTPAVELDATHAVAKNALRGSLAGSVGGKAIEMVTLLLLATLVPRELGSTDYGRFALALTVVTIVSLGLTLGGPTLMTRFVPAAPPDLRLALARRLGGRLLRGRAAQLAVVIAAAVLVGSFDTQRFPRLELALVVSALVASVVTTLILQVLLGLGRTGLWNARYPLQNAVLVVATIYLYHSAGVTGAVGAILVSSLVALVFALAVAGPLLTSPIRTRVEIPAGAMRFGAFQAGGAALTQFTHRGGVIAVAVLVGSEPEVGFTALATGLSLAGTYAILQMFTVSLPFVAPVHLDPGTSGVTHDDVTRAEATLRRLACWILAVIVPLGMIASVTVETWVPTLFGDSYRQSISAFPPAIAIVVLAPLGAFLTQVSALRLRPGASLVAGVVSASTFVVLTAILVPAGGAPAAVTATLAGVGASALVAIRMLPGAVGHWLAWVSFGGVGAVMVASLM